MKTIEIGVENDHLERLATSRKPSVAIAELIWNSLDADAKRVDVDYVDNGLGGVSKVTVVDDSPVGMTYAHAESAFKRLGGSWKKTAVETETEGRILHGSAGVGRLKAFALGKHVEWATVFKTPDMKSPKAFTITGGRGLKKFKLADPVDRAAPTGTVVTISDVDATYDALDDERVRQELTEQFALYLRQYPQVLVTYGQNRKIDPALAEERREDLELKPVKIGDRTVEAKLTVVEWKSYPSKSLALCDGKGFTLVERHGVIHSPGFNFTAYLQSDYLRELHQQNLLVVDELSSEVRPLVEAARAALRAYARKRSAERAAAAVRDWKTEEVYPYVGEAANPVEVAERQVFDIIAVNVSEHLPDFEDAPQKQKRFAFRLLRQSIEESPEAVQRILNDVLELPKEKQEDLAKLLKKTSLSAIIQASKVIADRLNFLAGLELLVFEAEAKKTLLERKQLHRILASNTWIFGEEFNLTADDESLNAVLQKHRGELKSVTSEDDPVLRDDGSQGVVDLMLSRRVPMPKAEERAHLVVELKRPSKKIDNAVTNQLESYAIAVANDERFRDTTTQWQFLAISNDMTEGARTKARQANRPEGMILDTASPRITAWVRTWGQVIDAARGRLEFFRKELDYSADQLSAREHLNDVYKKYLPDVLKDVAEDDADVAESKTKDDKSPASK